MMEHRNIAGAEIRAVNEETRSFTAKVLSYDTTDTYGTQFRAGCFADSIDKKLPRSTWAHQWDRPIGQVTAVRDSEDGLEMDFQLADFDAVPDARMAYSLIKDGTIDGFSVGFEPTEVRDAKGKTVTGRMAAGDVCYSGNLVEVSPVLVPSVPGTKTLSIRSDEPDVSKELVGDLLVRFGRGEIDLADALGELKTEGRAQKKNADPHAYAPTTGDGSVCSDCGGMADAKVHLSGTFAAYAGPSKGLMQTVSGRSIMDQDPGDNPIVGIQACDAALDEALTILNSLDPTTLDPMVAQAIALINAADAALDDVMQLTGIYDADDSVTDSSGDNAVGMSIPRAAEEDPEIAAALALINRRI